MEFNDNIYILSNKVIRNKEHCSTEEASKTSLILPFITALGYDTTDPLEVMPEAPCAIKGSDRIDYIIAYRGEYRLLVECKHWRENLDNHIKQLEQYFQSALKPYHTRIGILTNGIEYRFYADTERTNVMDDKPFFIFNVTNATEEDISCLKMFCKDDFNLRTIVSKAAEIKITTRLHDIVEKELSSPSEELVNLFWNKLDTGRRLTRQREQFTKQVKEEIENFTMSRICRAVENQMQLPPNNNEDTECGSDLTEEEQSIVDCVFSILSELVPKDRLNLYRTSEREITVRLDNNQWRPVCKLHITKEYKWINIGRYWPKSRKFSLKPANKHIIDDVSNINLYSNELIDIMTVMLIETHEKRIEWVELNHRDWLE